MVDDDDETPAMNPAQGRGQDEEPPRKCPDCGFVVPHGRNVGCGALQCPLRWSFHPMLPHEESPD